MTRRTVLTMLAIVLFAVLAIETAEVWARAGGGGSRGSRSYSAPARPAPQSPGLDYIVDDATGGLVEGSRSVPQHVEEFWSFVRPVGAHSWQLSAIQTG